MISILIPVYNTKSEYLNECLDSIFKQTYNQYEIIIINNGSNNEDTINYLNKINQNNLIKIYNCHRENGKKNLSIALNYGLTKCSFEYVARMDSDDIMLPNRLEKQVNHMIENPYIDILGTQMQNMFGDKYKTNLPLEVPNDFYKISTHFINHPTVMFKKNKVCSLGGYKEFPDHIPEDFILWTKALKNNLLIYNLPDVLVYYRNREDNLSQIDSKHKEWYDSIYEAIMRD